MVDLDEITATFAEYMEDEEAPVINYDSLEEILPRIGIASGLTSRLAPLMDPDGVGTISFEPFVNVVVEYLADSEESKGDEDCDRVFELLAGPDGRITLEALEAVRDKLGFKTSTAELNNMITFFGHQSVDKRQFYDLWQQLNNVLGAEVSS